MTEQQNFKLWQGDCLELMKDIPDNSIDMVLTDPPYGTTACKWDTVIDFDLMWAQLKRITKDNGAICLFGSEPFSSALRMSNIKQFKYDWVWQKDKATGFLNSKKQPLRSNEIISVFYKKQPTYNPQFWDSKPMNTVYNGGVANNGKSTDVYGKQKQVKRKELNSTKRYPITNIKFNQVNGQAKIKCHPTQKPVALLEYLIKTYTLENETVLDFTMGSGSTGVACKNLDRNFIGIEKDEKYFGIAEQRIQAN
jgi:site-specific DNA-methyltransferase (adenine-specific)